MICFNYSIFFINNIFKKDNQDLSFIASNFPDKRFEIYRQTIFGNMVNALRSTYPRHLEAIGR